MTLEEITKAKEHFQYGISHDIFSEPVTSYARTAVEALDKQMPNSKRAPFDSESISCGNCDSDISDSDYTHCPYCGQKLDWSCLSDSETTFECDGKTYTVLFDNDDEEDWE